MALSEREQTDESLRIERATADRSVKDKLSAIDEAADAVIKRARERADELLAGTRANIDRTPTPEAHPGTLAIQRLIEDETLRIERAEADETVRKEREAEPIRSASERVGTDNDLSSERARSDTALATRDEFLGVVSHELRNMLHGMVGFAAHIEGEARLSQSEEIAAHAQRIQRSGARMNRLIGDLVDIASIEAGRLTVTCVVGDPTTVLTEAVDTFQGLAEGRGISLALEIATPSLSIAFDPSRILQVLVNLLSNAIKFTPDHGRVSARVERVGDEAVFSFADTGIGIPPDMLEAVFQRFLQVKSNDRRGLGLGLYISNCIVQGHGGRIWVESRLGEGSVFRFALPLQPAC